MRNPRFPVSAFVALAACNQPQASSFYMTGVVDKTPAQVVDDLNGLPNAIGLNKDRYWRQHGVVLPSERRNLTGDTGENAGSFKDDIQTYWSPTGRDKGKLPIYIAVRPLESKVQLHVSVGGGHTRAESVPESTMLRLESWLKAKYGAESFVACENALC